MSTEFPGLDPRNRENAEPSEARNPVPLAVIVVVSISLGWAVGYIMGASPDADPAVGDQRSLLQPNALKDSATPLKSALAQAAAPNGEALYAAHCGACHQATGAGLPGVFPPLSGSAWVTEDEAILVQIMLHGISGPIEVSGTTYQGVMPAFGETLDDEQIAAVASFVRAAWDNNSASIDAAKVTALRAETRDRATPWAGGAELESLRRGQ